MAAVKILAFSGSARTESWNQKMVGVAAAGAAAAGGEVSLLNLGEYDLPIYNEDREAQEGLPEGVRTLKELFKEHHGFLIASPEYNGSISPLLKNTLDWISRPADGERPLEAYEGKIAAIMSASPGGLGGIRALPHIRTVLSGIRVSVIPEQVALGNAHQAFTEEGKIADPARHSSVEKLGEKVVLWSRAMGSPSVGSS